METSVRYRTLLIAQS